MFNSKSGTFFLNLLAATILMACSLNGPSFAQSQSPLQGLTRFEFTHATNNNQLLTLARQLRLEYMQKLAPGYQPEPEFSSALAYARYIPLGPANQDFLALYTFDNPDEECLPIGCSLTIFQRTGPRNWQTVLSVSTHEVWIGESPQQGIPKDLFLRTYLAPERGPPNQMGQWRWEDGKYKLIATHGL